MRSNLLLACMIFCASCAKWCEEEGDNNTSTNNATTGSSNNTSSGPPADCGPAAIGQTLPFDAGGALPFSFAINARFGNIDSSTDDKVSGATFDVVSAMPGDFEATYQVLREPIADPRALESEWDGRNRERASVSFDGATLRAWSVEDEQRDAIYFMAPHDGEVYEATLEWTSPAGCVEERRELRDLATRTLKSVDETSFP